jgi:DegV family protein with EDD domain
MKVSTSRPTPAEFVERYRSLGVREVVSVHLSAELSGTWEAAVLAAEEVRADGIAVRVVDSRMLAMGLGFAVIAAAQAAASGADGEAVERAAVQQVARTDVVFYVDTLEHLRRGGRIGAAAALLGTALAVKPLLHVTDGRIAPLEKVRTVSKAVGRLEDLAIARAGSGAGRRGRPPPGARGPGGAARGAAARRLPALVDLHVSEVGAVVGAHVGPGAARGRRLPPVSVFVLAAAVGYLVGCAVPRRLSWPADGGSTCAPSGRATPAPRTSVGRSVRASVSWSPSST